MADEDPRGPAPGLRLGLMAIVALGLVGMSTELLLIGHDEDVQQLIPLVIAVAGLVALTCVWVKPSVLSLRVLQFVALTCVGAGITGMTLHFNANAEFQLEIDPTLGGLALFWKVVEATAPPALAPGVMVQLGLLCLLSTYRHPALSGESATRSLVG